MDNHKEAIRAWKIAWLEVICNRFPFNDWAPALFFLGGEFSPLIILFLTKTTTKIALKINKKNTIKFIGFLIPLYRASLIQILAIKQLQFNDQKADRNQAKLHEMMFLWQRIVMDQKMDFTNISQTECLSMLFAFSCECRDKDDCSQKAFHSICGYPN